MIGDRVKVARTACGMTQDMLSEISGLSSSRISNIENELIEPTDVDVSKLSSSMSMPASYFVDATMPSAHGGRYRKTSSVPKKAQTEIEAQASLISLTISTADRVYKIKRTTIRPCDEILEDDSIEALASDARAALALPESGPIGNVTSSCEKAGIIIARVPRVATNDKLSGYSTWPDMGNGRPLILVSSSLPGDVLRATVAHELGHLLLHTRNTMIPYRVAEDQSWTFARSFVFPRNDACELFRSDNITLSKLRKVKARYGISIAMLIKTCESYGLVDSEKGRSLWKQYSSRKWRGNEPVEIGIERTTAIQAILKRMKSDGVEIDLPAFLSVKLSSSKS